MRPCLFVAAGRRALTLAAGQALAVGGKILDLRVPDCKTMREQESVAAEMQSQLKDRIGEVSAVGLDVVVLVEIGSTAGALLVIVEAVKSCMKDASIGAVVLRDEPLGATTPADVLQDIGLLGQAIWTYALDGRLTWSLVTDGKSGGMALTVPENPSTKPFGSRLYGE